MRTTTFSEQVVSLRRTLRHALTRRLTPRSDRPVPQLLALRVIRRGEARTQAELAERLMIDAPAASRLVVRLEADGLLRRLEGADRRCRRLQVTASAGREIAAIEDAMGWLDLQIREHLSQREIDASIAALGKVERGLRSTKAAP